MTADRRRLGIFHERNSFSPFEIAEAVAGSCELVWIVGWSPGARRVPTRLLARLGTIVDTAGMDEDAAVEHLASLTLDGIVVFTDAPQVLAARLAARLGLPFHSPSTALALSDKLVQRETMARAGIPVPAFVAVRPSMADGIGDFPWPAVLKPRRGAGSRDTFLVESPQALAATLATCEEEDFVLEERLVGRSEPLVGAHADMVSVETVVRDSTAEHVAVTGRFPLAAPFRETGSFLPADLPPADAEAVMAMATATLRALDVRRGILHTEIKLTPDGPRVIEINGRLGGGIAHMLGRVGGPPLLTWAVRLALSIDVGPAVTLGGSPVAFFEWVLAPGTATRVEGTEGIRDVRALPGVDVVRLNRQAGDTVDAREGSSGHVIAIEGAVGSHAELQLLRRRIAATLSLSFS